MTIEELFDKYKLKDLIHDLEVAERNIVRDHESVPLRIACRCAGSMLFTVLNEYRDYRKAGKDKTGARR